MGRRRPLPGEHDPRHRHTPSLRGIVGLRRGDDAAPGEPRSVELERVGLEREARRTVIEDHLLAGSRRRKLDLVIILVVGEVDQERLTAGAFPIA